MDVRSAARALGGKVSGRQSVLCPGPGHGRKDQSLSVTFDERLPDGFSVHSFAGDDWQTCKDHVRHLLGFDGFTPGKGERPMRPIVERPREPDAQAVKRADFAAVTWKEARPIFGTPAERYLLGRGIDLPRVPYSASALRFHPACPFRLDSGETVRLPAMIGAMVNVETSEFQGIHRTALAEDGSGKAQVRGLGDPRKMLGSSASACVKLSPDEDVTSGLGIGEGLETCLAVMAMGFSPMWAILTAGNVAAFPVLAGIEALTVFADNDKSGTGQKVARECGLRWVEARREAVIWTPPLLAPDDPKSKGSDFNDLREVAA